MSLWVREGLGGTAQGEIRMIRRGKAKREDPPPLPDEMRGMGRERPMLLAQHQRRKRRARQ